MAHLWQNILVLAIVAVCAAAAIRQIVGTLTGKKSSGCCGCPGGCGQAGKAKPEDCPSCRTVFLPAGELQKRGR